MLSDPGKRKIYDSYGMDGVNANASGFNQGQNPGQGPFGNGNPNGANFGDFFDMFGGRGGPFGG